MVLSVCRTLTLMRRVLVIAALSCWHVSAADPEPVLRRVFSPYWTIAGGHESTIQLHNSLIDRPLAARLVLLSESGDRTDLQEVSLGPLGNVSIDLRETLGRVGSTNLTYGSALFEYLSPYAGALLAETTVTQAAKTLAYTIIGSERGASASRLYSVYWFPPGNEPEVYVALQNTSSATVHVVASLDNAGALIPFGSVTLGPSESRVVNGQVRDGRSNPGQGANQFGAIVLSHDAPDGVLNASGWVEMESIGYSNMMTFHDPARHKGTKLYGAQVFLGSRNDVLASRRTLNVDSNLVLLNVADAPVSATAELAYEINGQVVRVPLEVGRLAPHEATEVRFDTVRVPLGASTGALTLSYDGPEGAVMGRVFGMAEGTFGFYSTLETYTPASVNEVYWTTAGDADSILSVTNFGDSADKITIVLTYAGGKLSLPELALQPLQSATVNVRDWKEKGALPAEFGGFRIFGTSGRSKLLVKEHVIREREKLSAPFYGSPPYATSFRLDPNSFAQVTGNTDHVYGIVTWSDYSQTYDYGSINSSSTSVATVSGYSGYPTYYATITAQGAGTTTLNADSAFYPIDSSGLLYDNFQAQAQVLVCDFTISPGQFNSSYCSNPTLQQKTFSANVSPSLSQCFVSSPPASGCSVSNASGDISLDVTPQICNISSFSVTGTARFYGPTSGHSGSLTLGFSLRMNGRDKSHSSTIPVVCP